MILIRNLSKTIIARLLYARVNLTIQKTDRIGIVGPNGSGKTTLLKIIAGLEWPDEGEVEAESERIGFLEQVIPEDEKIETLAHYFRHYKTHEVLRALEMLHLPYHGEKTIESHSGGEQTKIQLAKVLLERPSCLLLDEPTNHLEGASIQWLEEFLANFHGAVLAVSHDRRFLNQFANKILETDPINACIHIYEGNFEDYKQARAKRIEKWSEEYKQQQKELLRMQEYIKEKQRQASQFPDPAKGRQIRQMEKRIKREITDNAIVRPNQTLKIKQADFEGNGHNGKLILRAANLGYKLGEKTIFENCNTEMRGKDRVRLHGPNGSGKSTFIKLLLGQTFPSSGQISLGKNVRVGYFDQTHAELPGDKSLLDFAHTLPHKGDERAFLAKYGFTGMHVQKLIKSLSQGEQVRLVFARLLLENYDLLILDEPTNHLDIESREVIEQALQNFEGSLLTVSHDEYFVEQVSITKLWQIQNKQIKETLA